MFAVILPTNITDLESFNNLFLFSNAENSSRIAEFCPSIACFLPATTPGTLYFAIHYAMP